MFTVFDESEIDDLAKKNEYKKIKVSLREEGRLSSYVKVNSLSVSPVMDYEQFSEKIEISGWVQSRRFSHHRDCCDLSGQAEETRSNSNIQEEHEQRRH